MKTPSDPSPDTDSNAPRAKRARRKQASDALADTRESNPGARDTTEGAARPRPSAENAIRPIRERSRAAAPPAGAPGRRELNVAAKAAASRTASGKARERQAVPEEVLERFIGVGAKYYFPDGAPAFVDRGTRLTTPSENTEVVRSLVAISQARGWEGIRVTGTERFRREAWFAAQRAGLEVRGYQPTPVEQAQLVRGLGARRGGTREPEVAAPASAKPATTEAPREAVFTGRLLDHGRAPFRHDMHEPMSYYVRLQTREGEREVWGVDLERAVRHSLSGAGLGDEVSVRSVSRKPVTIQTPEHDAQGRVIGHKPLESHRNGWIVERSDFLAARERLARVFRDEKVSAQDAVKRHAELQGSYLKLQAVKLGAERDFQDPAERVRLLARARVLIAESIERGEPLEPVQLRERRPETVRTPADPERTR